MNIDFGVVKKYFPDRGFGFVTCTFFTEHQSELFFHIKNIKRTRPDLAEKLDNEVPLGSIYFWYDVEVTNKGEQIRTALKSDAIHEMLIDHLPPFVDKIQSTWKDIDSTIPIWLHEVTVDLVGAKRANELSSERDAIEKERKELEEKRHKELKALQKIEEKEFELLVAEMEPLGFTHSNQVSMYIMENKLGYKYKHISGIVQMEQDGTTWNFRGGFPPNIYASLCQELGLNNQGSRARAVGFEPFKDLD